MKTYPSKLSGTCRLCLMPVGQSAAVRLTFDKITDTIHYVTDISVDIDESLPKFICRACYVNLKHFEAFKKKCIANDDLLRNPGVKTNDVITDQDEKNCSAINLTYDGRIEPSEVVVEDEIDNERITVCLDLESFESNSVEICCPRLYTLGASNGTLAEPASDVAIISLEQLQYFREEEESKKKSLDFENSDIKIQVLKGIGTVPDNNTTSISNRTQDLGISIAESDIKPLCSNSPEVVGPQTDCETVENDRKIRDNVDTVLSSSAFRQITVKQSTVDHSRICSICRKSFATASSMKRHKVLHTGEKNYVCPICGKQFNQSSILRRHSFIHSVNKPYRCHLCDRTFTQKEYLKLHITHIHFRTETRFHCSFCDKVFKHHSGLSRHKKLHSSSMEMYECGDCGKTFTDRSSCRRHVTNIHASEYKAEVRECPEHCAITPNLRF